MKRAWRWLRRLVLGALALVVVAIATVLIVLHTAWGREQIRSRVEVALREAFPGGATIGSLTGSVFGELVVHDVEVRARDGSPLVAAKALRIELALLPLLGKTARVDRLVIEDVSVHIKKQPPKPPMPTAPPSQAAWSVALPAITVRRAMITIETPKGDIVVDALDLGAAAEVPSGGPVTASAVISGTWRARAAPIVGVAQVQIGGDIAVPTLAVSVGGVLVVGRDLHIDDPAGSVTVTGTAAAIAALAPEVVLAGAVIATVTATPAHGHAGAAPGETHVVLSARTGQTTIDAVVLADPAAGTARGVVGVASADLGPLTHHAISGRGSAVAAVATDGTSARATVIAHAAVEGAPQGDAIVAVAGTLDRVSGFVIGAGAGGSGAVGIAAIDDPRGARVFERSRVSVAAHDLWAASAGRAPITGAGGADLVIEGPLTALVISGTAHGTRLGYDTYAVARASARFAGTVAVGAGGSFAIRGTTHADLAGVAREGRAVGTLAIDVTTRSDRKLDVTARAFPAAAPIQIDATAVITPGNEIDIALGRHRLRLASGAIWAGAGGRVRVGTDQITVRGLRTASAGGHLAVDATLGRSTGAVAASVDASEVPMAMFGAQYRGQVGGKLSVTRTDDRWAGGGTLQASGVVASTKLPPIDGTATIAIAGRRITVDATASTAEVGRVRAVVEVVGPRDLTDRAAWMKVARDGLHSVTLELADVKLAALSQQRTAGTVDGKLEIIAGEPRGVLHVRGVPTPAGAANADVTIALPDAGFIDVTAKATLGTLGRTLGAADVGVRVAIPMHPFDPDAWQQLGPSVLDSATLKATDIVIDPPLLAVFHVVAPYRGRATVDVQVGAGATSAHGIVDLHEIRGGVIARGIDLHLDATADADGTRAAVHASSGATTLLDLPDARAPVTLERWVSAPRSALTAPISGVVTIPTTDARDVLAILDRHDVTSGTLAGRIVAAGTIGTPTATGAFDIGNLNVAQPISGKPIPTLTALRVTGSWGGASGEITIAGHEANGGQLDLDARGRPDELATLFATLAVKKFDVAPVAAFLPGSLVAASGALDGWVTVRGLDPHTGTIRGSLHLTEGRLPIAPAIGTIRKADARVTIDETGISAKVDAKLGGGSVKLVATTGLDASSTTLDIELRKVSPIGALQPRIDADIHGTFERTGRRLIGALTVRRASVFVPEQVGRKLLESVAPSDLVFVDVPIPVGPIAARAPQDPWLVATVKIESTRIEVPDFAVQASAAGRLTVFVGDSLGMDGEIVVERGNADLFGHRYRVDSGRLAFDGTTDPTVDLTIAHDFPDVTTFVRFGGRVSDLDPPELTSQPGIYTRSQLLGFFLGGEPGGDPSKQTREAAAGAGSALLSTVLGKKIKKVLPLDVLRCDPGGGQTAASCTFGYWLSQKLFLSYKQKANARPDENTGDGVLEYYWRKDWTIEATGGDRGYYGGDLLWRKRW